jgi:hypothetical protein
MKPTGNWWLLLFGTLALAGCTTGTVERATEKSTAAAAAKEEEADIQKALAGLDPADRELAEQQKFCAVQNKNRLGEMGTPVKVMVKDQPVFLCCKSCKEEALADPDKTLAKVKELRMKYGPAQDQ